VKDSLEAVAKDLLPPVLLRALRRQWPKGIHFSDHYRTWDDADDASTGYDLPSILKKVADASLKVKLGEAVYERDSVLFDRIEYSWPLLAALMWVAAENHGRLSVLDFGGSLGTAYFQNRKFLEKLSVRWSIVEQPHFVAVGRERFEDDRLSFHECIEEAVNANQPDTVFFGGSLQFLQHPYALLEQLAGVPHKLLILDRTPFSELVEDRICVQHVPPKIYKASYPSHIFSLQKFERWVKAHGWAIVESFEALEGVRQTNSGLEFTFMGMLLAR
jgi:putative methyltransferase (TIGR04325 family)